MITETFPSHFNPQNLAKTLPTTAQPPPQPLTPPQPLKPTVTVELSPAPAKTLKTINFSSASA